MSMFPVICVLLLTVHTGYGEDAITREEFDALQKDMKEFATWRNELQELEELKWEGQKVSAL